MSASLIHSINKRVARLGANPTLARRHGALFLLDRRNWIDNRLLARAPFEDAQIAAARRVVQAERIDTVLDIGANIGLYSIVLGLLPAVAAVHAFEPVARNANQLGGNVFANALDDVVRVHRLALSDREGEAQIHVDPRSTGVSTLEAAQAARRAGAYRAQETVRLARLDDVLRLEGARVFVKIDVEGHALAVLRGMPRLLASNEVVLQVELLETDRTAIVTALDEAGYRLDAEISGDGVFRRR
ncbi:MAG: FkbM family methyltransferase [Salinarimonas sp.]